MYFYDNEEIKNRMNEKGINIRELSRIIGLPYYTVYCVVKGKREIGSVSVRVYKKIVDELWKEGQ